MAKRESASSRGSGGRPGRGRSNTHVREAIGNSRRIISSPKGLRSGEILVKATRGDSVYYFAFLRGDRGNQFDILKGRLKGALRSDRGGEWKITKENRE